MRKLILMLAVLLLLPCCAQAIDTPYYSNDMVLSTIASTPEQRELADHLYFKIASSQESIALPEGTLYADVKVAMSIIFHDYPELFHYSGQYYTYRPSDDSPLVTKIEPVYTLSPTEYLYMSNNLWIKIDEILSHDYNLLEIHDYLVDNVSYSLDAPDCENAYGALVNGQAKCSGYADALTLLYRRAGVACGIVNGIASHDDGTTVSHAWNIANVGGISYIDASWNDTEPYANTHWYFGIPASLMHRNHTPDDPTQTPEGVAGLDWHTNFGLYVTDQASLYAALPQLAQNREVSLRLSDDMYKLLREEKNAQFKAYNKQAPKEQRIPMDVTFAALYSDVQKTIYFFEYEQ